MQGAFKEHYTLLRLRNFFLWAPILIAAFCLSIVPIQAVADTHQLISALLDRLQEKDAAAYRKIRLVQEQEIKGDISAEQARQRVQQILLNVFNARLPYAPPDVLRQFNTYFLIKGRQIEQVSPLLCQKFVMGQLDHTGLGQLPASLAETLVDNNARFMLIVLDVPAIPTPRIIEAEEATKLYSTVFAALEAQKNDTAPLFDPLSSAYTPAHVCSSFLNFYAQINMLPAAQADALLRYRFYHIGQESNRSTRAQAYDLRVSTDGTLLVFSGYIRPGVAEHLRRLLEQHPELKKIYTNGEQGGDVAEARRMRDLIRSRGLETHVTRQCASACAIVFMGGVRRYVHSKGRLGFHRSQIPGFPPGMAPESESDFSGQEIPEEFNKRVSAVIGTQLWFPSRRDLYDNHIVTALHPPRQH